VVPIAMRREGRLLGPLIHAETVISPESQGGRMSTETTGALCSDRPWRGVLPMAIL
jgi:hypothetical protein